MLERLLGFTNRDFYYPLIDYPLIDAILLL